MEPLVLIYPEGEPSARLEEVLQFALNGRETEVLRRAADLRPLEGRRVLFALSLGETGINLEWCAMLAALRRSEDMLEGCVGGLLVDARSELYTKAAARELVFAANRCGCAFVGKALVELTASLSNFHVLARLWNTDRRTASHRAARELTERMEQYVFERAARPEIVVLQASSHRTSNTMALWERVRQRLGEDCAVTEIGLRNGTLADCSGCPYAMCLHFGETGSCFYGGVIVEEVYPALRRADAVVLICPNYNDALSANLTACVNRLTALFRTTSFEQKALYAIVVSGYSGGDIVAQQVLGALCLNKAFYLPPRFALVETANDAGEALRLPGIDGRLDAFAQAMRDQLL